MPRSDGTGPMGKGSRTGRGMGNCQPNCAGSNLNLTQGRGKGLGRGQRGGRGLGRRLGAQSEQSSQ